MDGLFFEWLKLGKNNYSFRFMTEIIEDKLLFNANIYLGISYLCINDRNIYYFKY